jgi:transposase
MEKISLGIDIAAKTFDANLRLGGRILSSRSKVSNDAKGFQELISWIAPHLSKSGLTRKDVHVVMEATGSYHERLVYFLTDQGFPCHVILASRAKHYLKSLDEHKTDKLDAKNLARLGIERELPTWQPPSEEVIQLRQLTRQREAFSAQSTAVKNQLHALGAGYHSDSFVKKSYEDMLDNIQKAIKGIDDEISKILKSATHLHENLRFITSIPGVGLLTAVVLIAETDNFRQIESRSQLVSYAGYDITQKTSGKTVKGKPRMSKVGNTHIRRILYMAASSAIQHNIACQDLYERVLSRNGGIPMKAHVAVQRKLLVMIYSLVKNRAMYDLNKHLKESNLADKPRREKRQKEEKKTKTAETASKVSKSKTAEKPPKVDKPKTAKTAEKSPKVDKPKTAEKSKTAEGQVAEIGG